MRTSTVVVRVEPRHGYERLVNVQAVAVLLVLPWQLSPMVDTDHGMSPIAADTATTDTPSQWHTPVGKLLVVRSSVD